MRRWRLPQMRLTRWYSICWVGDVDFPNIRIVSNDYQFFFPSEMHIPPRCVLLVKMYFDNCFCFYWPNSGYLPNRTPPTCRARCRNTRLLKLSCQLTRAALMPYRSLGKCCWIESIMPPVRWRVAWMRSAPSGRNCSRPLSSKVLAAGKLYK